MIVSWQKQFPSDVLNQGFNDYQDGVVTGLKKRSYGYEASVAEGELETVEIHVTGNVITRLGCTCQVGGETKFCRHMAAVLLTLDEMLPQPLMFEVAEDETVEVKLMMSQSDWEKWKQKAELAGMTPQDLMLVRLREE